MFKKDFLFLRIKILILVYKQNNAHALTKLVWISSLVSSPDLYKIVKWE